MRKLILFLVGLVLMCGLVSATTVTRSLSSNSMNKNEAVTVTLTVSVQGDTYYVIDEEYPSHMTVSSVSGSGDYTTTPGHIFWTVLSNAQNTAYTYNLNSGNQDGTFSFTGTYGTETKQEGPIGGTTTLKVGTGGGSTTTTSATDYTWLFVIGGIALVFVMFLKKK
jgi:hypothetical protein